MSLSFFTDKYILPSENEVFGVLGKAAAIWDNVRQHIEKYGSITEEWKIYSAKVGWCKKIFLISGKQERNIIFLYPNIDFFTCVLVFGEKAVLVAEKSEIPENVLDSISCAKQYKEGRSFNVEVSTPQDFEVLKKLIDIKIQT